MSDQQVSVPPAAVTVTPELLEAVAPTVVAVLVLPQPQPAVPSVEEAADLLTARQFARRLGISHETVRRLAIVGELPRGKPAVLVTGPGRAAGRALRAGARRAEGCPGWFR